MIEGNSFGGGVVGTGSSSGPYDIQEWKEL